MTAQTLAIVVLLVSFFVMIFLRFPIAYAVGLSSVLCMMVQGQALTDVCRLMVKGISSFSLMAVPFFITMGVLMGSGGISEKLIALADACVGWMRGGMAMVNIVASYFFGGISGSASADTASIGSIMIPMMVDQGYDADFSTAVTTDILMFNMIDVYIKIMFMFIKHRFRKRNKIIHKLRQIEIFLSQRHFSTFNTCHIQYSIDQPQQMTT